MTNAQKVIKYLSIAFAFYLIISLCYIFFSVFNIISDSNENKEDNYKIIELTRDFDNINIELTMTSLDIKTGDKFKIETNNEYISIKENNNKITIKEKANLKVNKNYKLNITLPDKFFNKVRINNGAGKVAVNGLSSDDIDFDFGAGKVLINKLVADNINMDTGAGSVKITNSNLNDLDLNIGIGELYLTGYIKGNNKIDSGIGKVNIKLLDNKDNYTFKVSKGIGKVVINDKEISDDETIGEGNNLINIDGGIGNIKILTN